MRRRIKRKTREQVRKEDLLYAELDGKHTRSFPLLELATHLEFRRLRDIDFELYRTYIEAYMTAASKSYQKASFYGYLRIHDDEAFIKSALANLDGNVNISYDRESSRDL